MVAQRFGEYGLDVLGVVGLPRAVIGSLLPGRVVLHDFTTGPWAPNRDFDICLCTEFAEHVAAQFEENWMVAVDRSLLHAAAGCCAPGQSGWHHLNEQPDEYWIDRFTARGFRLLTTDSEMLRGTCERRPSKWGPITLLLFRRQRPAAAVPQEEEKTH